MRGTVMGRAVFAGLLAAAVGTAACASAGGNAPSPPPVVGGWSEADVTDDAVIDAAAAALAQLPPDSASLASIDSAEQQVVAGVNFHLILTLTDGSQWDVIVWRKLDGSHELTGATAIEQAKPVLGMEAGGLRLDTSPEVGDAIPFGTSQEEVIAALAFRGTPEVSTNEECGAGPIEFASWEDGVSLLFQDGQFQGWSLDDRATGVTMADGTAIGMTLAELGRESPVFVEESTLGEEFTTEAGVSGILSGKGPEGKVEALWSGLSCVFR